MYAESINGDAGHNSADNPEDGDRSGLWRAAMLSRTQITPLEGPYRIRRAGTVGARMDAWAVDMSARLGQLDLAPSLAENIGSSRWWRGLGTMLALGAAAISFWPDFAPLEAAPAMFVDDAVQDEFRSQSIMPLALGSDSGRRMGATQAVRKLAAAPERPRVQLVATLAKGDSFQRMLQRAGVGNSDAARVAELVGNAISTSDIEPGTQLDITLGRRSDASQARPLESLKFRARFDLALAIERGVSGLSLIRKPIAIDETPLRIRGTVGNSLYRSARAAGAPPSAVQAYLKALGGHMDIDRSVRSTDTFDMIVSYRRAETGERQAGQLIYAGVDRGGKSTTQMMRWGDKGKFYEASGVGETRTGLVRPVPGAVSSNYGMRRHPILGYRRMHSGQDYRAGYGTPIRAVTDGRVAYAGRKGGYGNFVRLNHAGGLGTGYAHMSRIAVRSGASVQRGQVIGYVGSTGLSTGPHLHYEMYRGSRKIDPASVTYVTRSEISGDELRRFRNQLAAIKTVEAGAALTDITPSGPQEVEVRREIDKLEAPAATGTAPIAD